MIELKLSIKSSTDSSYAHILPASKSDYCPHCCNHSLVGCGGNRVSCDSCGAEYKLTPTTNDRVELVEISSATQSNATSTQDKRLSPTSERYKGYLIALDRGGDGYNVYDKHRELEDCGYPSKEAAKQFIDELTMSEGVPSETSNVVSSTELSEVAWNDLEFSEQVKLMKDYITRYNGTKIFEDFADYVGQDVFDIVDCFSDAEYRGDIRVPQSKQSESEFANDDIYSSSDIVTL